MYECELVVALFQARSPRRTGRVFGAISTRFESEGKAGSVTVICSVPPPTSFSAEKYKKLVLAHGGTRFRPKQMSLPCRRFPLEEMIFRFVPPQGRLLNTSFLAVLASLQIQRKRWLVRLPKTTASNTWRHNVRSDECLCSSVVDLSRGWLLSYLSVCELFIL